MSTRLMRNFDGGAFRIGWDAGNGAAGPALEKLVETLPGEHHLLYTDVDGRFPNHHPDPTDEKNLADLKALVAREGPRFRHRLRRRRRPDRRGRRRGPGGLGRPVARHPRRAGARATCPGATIIADVKASQALYDRIAELGGKPLMWKTGHSLIKSKMKETGAPLAGEMSGHIFFAHDYYGFDDALYAAVRLIRAVSQLGGSLTALRSAMPAVVNTPELRFQVDEARKFAVVEEVLERLAAAGAEVDRTDGARVNTADGWWLLRASNTQDVLVARAEAKDQAGPRPAGRADRRAARFVRHRARPAGGALMPKFQPRALALLRGLGAARDRRDGARRDLGGGGAVVRPAAHPDAALRARPHPLRGCRARTPGPLGRARHRRPRRWRSGSTPKAPAASSRKPWIFSARASQVSSAERA